MTSVADAYVELHVDGDHVEGEIRHNVKSAGPGADKEADKVGKSSGGRFGDGFLKGFRDRMRGGGGNFKKSFEGLFKGLNLKGLLAPSVAAIVPFLTSSVSALSGALVAFTGAAVQATAASAAFAGVLGSLLQAKMVTTIAGLKEIGKAAGGDAKAMAALGPSAQRVAKAVQGLGGAWGKVKTTVQDNLFAGVDVVLRRIGANTLPMLQKRLGGTATVLNGVFKDLGGFAASERGVRQFGAALQGNNRVLKVLGGAAVPLLRGILGVYNALIPSAVRLAAGIRGSAREFAAWANSAGRAESINAFMGRAFANAKNLWGIFKNLGRTLVNVFSAATPSGEGLLATLNRLTKRLADFTSLASSRNAIADWAQKGIEVSGRLFKGLGQIGKALLPLFNPSIADGYLSVFAKITPVIGAVVKAVQAVLAPVLSSLGKAFADNGPKFAALFKALGPLLGGIGAVIGEIIRQSLDMLGTIAAVVTPVVKVVAGILGPVLKKFAPVIAAVILLFTSWGAKLVSLVPVIGKFIAPIVRLAQIIYSRLAPAFDFVFKVFGRVVGAVAAAGRGIFNTGKVFFEGFGFVVKNVMGGIGEAVSGGWRFVRAVFSTALRFLGAVVRTYFNVYRTIIVTVFNAIRAVVTGAWRFITSVVRNGASAISGAVRTGLGVVRNLFTTVWGAVSGATGRAFRAIVGVVRGGVSSVVGMIRSIPGKIAALATSFLNAGRDLGRKVMSGIGKGLSSAAGFVGDIGSAVKRAINSALHLPVTIKGPGPLPDFHIPAFARGTISAPGGLALVGERGPEVVELPRGSKVNTANATRNMAAAPAGLPSRMILRIGSRDFEAYLSPLVDDRVDAAVSLANQGSY